MYDFSQHRFRCSSWGHLFTDPQGKSNLQKYNEAVEKYQKLLSEYALMPDTVGSGKPSLTKPKKLLSVTKQSLIVEDLLPIKDEKKLSITACKHLLDTYSANQYNLHTDRTSKAMDKGTLCEEDSITLYSRIKKVLFRKNDKRLFNDYLQGEPDLFTGPLITCAETIIDIKTSWDGISFHRNLAEDEVKSLYYYQLMGYMWLTGARYASVAYCLVNTPEGLIEQAKKSLWYKVGCPKEFTTEYEEFEICCTELEKSMNYDHIPLKEKIIEFNVEYDETVIDEGIERIENGRKFLINLQQQRVNPHP